jgi:hypothetical protein
MPPEPVVAATVKGTATPPPCAAVELPVLYGVVVVVTTFPVEKFARIVPVKAIEMVAVVNEPVTP